MGILAVILFWQLTQNKKKYRLNKEHGSARWGKKADAAPYMSKNMDDNIILTNTEFLTMNSRPKNPKYARNKNILVIGGSGSGKTFFYAKPNIMQTDSLLYPVSLIITDPKGGLASETGQLLLDKGVELRILNTIDMKKSMKYNPFEYIRSEKDILTFVTALIANTDGDAGKQSGEDFWVKAEKMLYQALVGLIFHEYPKEDRNMNALVELINMMEVREEDESFENAVDIIFKEIEYGRGYEENPETKQVLEKGENPQPDHFAVRQYKKYRLAAGKTAKSILISCGARLAPFDIGAIRDLTSTDELELDKLGGYLAEPKPKLVQKTKIVVDKDGKSKKIPVFKTVNGVKKPVMSPIRDKNGKIIYNEPEVVKQKYALFVIVSDTDKSFNFIVALMYTQLFNLLCYEADNKFEGRLPVHVRMILDEFANIGKIPDFETLITTIRSREISVTPIIQTLSQLKTIYKDASETIVGNCDTQLFLGGKEKTTLEDISKMLGKETIDSFNTSKSGGSSKGGSVSYQKMGRELMSTDEVGVMDNTKCILQIRGERPFFSDKYKTKEHKNYKFLSDYDPKRRLDVEKFINERRKKEAEKTSIKKDNKKKINENELVEQGYLVLPSQHEVSK
ncbi:MAG: type IV secretory system conjugative DNA transfer family protein [Defluviitaleaceae bacterium]|nr:type IV secretory system conjugative DNA transfer family protein [Defluviitaleaceae bacterium]